MAVVRSDRCATFGMALILVACASDAARDHAQGGAPGDARPAPSREASPSNPTTQEAPPSPPRAKSVSTTVKWLGASGFLLTRGGESVLTAPLFTRPNAFTVSTGLPAQSDTALVAAKIDDATLANVRAIVSGHAHYDHLLDVPSLMQRSGATLYANTSARNLLAAWAPDRASKCAGTKAQSPTIARSRVVAMDDAIASSIDWTHCAAKKPSNAPLQGTWVSVPNSHVRILGVCSEHPDQVGPYHFGAGDVTEEACEPPQAMPEWKEGLTIAFLIDFLDPTTNAPVFRAYYQDAPSNAPLGHIPAAFLADREVDLALLCVGSSNNVDDEPHGILASLHPKRAIGGHWEDFFRSVDEAPRPITLLDVDDWLTKARAVLPPAASGPTFGTTSAVWTIDGKPSADRAVIPQPNDEFVIPPL